MLRTGEHMVIVYCVPSERYTQENAWFLLTLFIPSNFRASISQAQVIFSAGAEKRVLQQN